MRVWFSTPAYQRYELSAICFEERAWAINKLRNAGIEAECVVVADDDNLDLARSFEFHTVERDNQWLGMRFNDGYEYACKNGATHVAPIGSDSWIDPQFIIDAPELGKRDVLSSRHYVRINQDATIRRQLWVPVLQGVSYLLPYDVLEKVGFRPCQEHISRGCDGSTWQGVHRVSGRDVAINTVWSESHPFETTAFESWPQITQFNKLGGRWGRGDTHGDVFTDLRDYYPDHIVDKVEQFYEDRRMIPAGLTGEALDARVREIVAQVLGDNRIPTVIRQKSRAYIEQAARLGLQSR